MIYKIDLKKIYDGKIHVKGWVLPKDPEANVKFSVYDAKKQSIDFKLVRQKRNDVAEIYLKDYNGNTNFGFDIEFDCDENSLSNYCLIIETDVEKVAEKLNKDIINKFNATERKKKDLFISFLNKNTFKRAINFFVKKGPKAFISKVIRKIKRINIDYDYSRWYELTKITEDELNLQRKHRFEFEPLLSVVIPTYDTSDEFLMMLFKSLLNQTYQNFEICVVDATNYNNCKNNPKNFFEKLKDVNDPLNLNNNHFDISHINIKYLDSNLSIADNTNVGINMAKGEYIVLCDHDDTITLDALYQIVDVINKNTNALLIYSDEDKVDTKDEVYFEPAFKPDFNLDMLLSVNYFCHLTTIKKSLLDELYRIDKTYERPEYNGAQDYDLFLRLVCLIINDTYNDGRYDTTSIIHIPKVLYHWRCHIESTSKNSESKLYAFQNGEKAVYDFYKRCKIKFEDVLNVEKGHDFGLYHTVYSKNYNEPLISIIIPNKDHVDDLSLAINSICNGNYNNIEFIICENNSKNSDTFKFYDELKKDNRIKVITYEGDFNYSKINNYARKFANSNYLLFLNNDVEMINKDSLHEMLSYLRREDVGAVGSKLLYKDNTYQHAGVIIGIGGIADHSFKGINDFDSTYMNRAQIVQDLNAVTAACIMVKSDIFDKLGGFDEKLAVAFNDIDLCLRIRKEGYLIVYNPYSSFYHYESKSRGLEDTDEKVNRFNHEFAYFVKRWNDKLITADEYYNPNLTLRQNNFALRILELEKIGEPFKLDKTIVELASKM